MVDKKVYKTDYESEFSKFFSEQTFENRNESIAVTSEIEKYSNINKYRDSSEHPNSRNKLWTGF